MRNGPFLIGIRSRFSAYLALVSSERNRAFRRPVLAVIAESRFLILREKRLLSPYAAAAVAVQLRIANAIELGLRRADARAQCVLSGGGFVCCRLDEFDARGFEDVATVQ